MDPMTRRKAMMMLAASSGGGQGILPVEWENSKLMLKFDETQAQAIKSGQMFSCTVDGIVLIAYVSKFPYSDSYQSAGGLLLAYGGNLHRGYLIFYSETTAYFSIVPNGASSMHPRNLGVITLPDVTFADNGKVLGVKNGEWVPTVSTIIINGTMTSQTGGTWTSEYTMEELGIAFAHGTRIVFNVSGVSSITVGWIGGTDGNMYALSYWDGIGVVLIYAVDTGSTRDFYISPVS